MLLRYLNACTAILFSNPQLIPSEPAQSSLQSPAIILKAFLAGYIPEKESITEQVCGFTSHIRGARAELRKDEQMESADDVS